MSEDRGMTPQRVMDILQELKAEWSTGWNEAQDDKARERYEERLDMLVWLKWLVLSIAVSPS